MAHISDIILIRTDTTLDLSQKAEKAGYSDNSVKPKSQIFVRKTGFRLHYLIVLNRAQYLNFRAELFVTLCASNLILFHGNDLTI
ncbi:hypothetical protein N665_0120s0011, partial [Sinapis alba]